MPGEVREAIVQHVREMSDNAVFWEGDGVPVMLSWTCPSDFMACCSEGELAYNFYMSETPYGGWIVKTEMDVVGDDEKETVWLVIRPDVGDMNTLSNVLVYDKKGAFLFHAPPQILMSKKAGDGSRGYLYSSSQMRYGYTDSGADEWTVTADGVVMRSYDMREQHDPRCDMGGIPDLGLLRVKEQRFSRQGVSVAVSRYAPTDSRYAQIRDTLRTIGERPSYERTESVNHVASLVDFVTSTAPVWQSGREPLDALMEKWVAEHPDALRMSQNFSARQILKLLEQ